MAKPLAANATPSALAPETAGPTGAATGTGGHGVAAAGPTTAPVCSHCGVVESVQAVQHKGQASGAGAVAGGVLGGVLGHQMGGGNGRTAMTVLGAVGGGLAGNEVEKRSKSTTVYRVKVRTDSGALRTVEQATAPAVGQRVRLDGTSLHAINP
jgi:outer membrane lipoprotein SlyB